MTPFVFDRLQPFNQLPLLPPLDVEIIDVKVMRHRGLASRALGALNKNLSRLPNPNMLVNTIALQKARSSSELENIFTTSEELYKAMAEAGTKTMLRIFRSTIVIGLQKIPNMTATNITTSES